MTTSRRRPRIGSDSAHSWARNLTLGNPHAKAVLMALCFYVNDEGRCHCGIATLAQDTDLSETTVRSRLRWLDDIGAIVRVPQWLDEHGRRSYDHHGRDGRENHRKRTSDEISLALDEDGEAIEERARGKENPARVVSSEEDAPFDPSPHTGLDGDNETVSPMPALCQPCDSAQVLDSSELEQEDSPPTPPPPLGGRSKIVSDEKRASFERFSKTYPSPIVDYEATLRLWASLSDEDTEDAIKGARGYARFLADLTAQKRSRNVKDAHRWLKHRQWIGFLTTAAAKRDEQVGLPIWVAEGSDEAAAWAVFKRIFSRKNEFSGGKMLVPSQWPPLIGDGTGEWYMAVEGTGQFAAWMRRIREGPRWALGLVNRKIEGRWVHILMVPSEWPPPKTVPGTLCTDEDMRELARG